MFTPVEISSSLELPYKLIDLNSQVQQFLFLFKCFDNNQTDYSINADGVTGSFEIRYKCNGIDSHFECDITIGNVFDFYNELSEIYNNNSCKNIEVKLKNYGDNLKRTYISFILDKFGHCRICGNIKNKNTQYLCGIQFEIEQDQTIIPEILSALKRFFEELRFIQGHNNFY